MGMGIESRGSRNVRIAINAWFLNRPDTGSGQYLQNLLREMQAAAPELALLLAAPEDRFSEIDLGPRVELWPVPSERGQSALGKVWFEQVEFPRICRRWQADLAHVPYWGSPLWPRVPTVVTIHDLIPLVLPAYRGGPAVRLYTRLVVASARRAAHVITDSLASKRNIEVHLRLPSERVECIYLAVGSQFHPHPSADDASIRRRYHLPERYVLYLAGHDPRKNVASLVEAFATVARADDDVTLVIGGNLPEKADPLLYDPRPLVSALGLESTVQFPGWVDEAHKPALLRGAACVVFASRYEGFGLPVLEALGCGAPVVASDASSLPELLGDAGFAVDPDDVAGLAGAILACLVDTELAAELRRRGPIQAARFDWGQTAHQTLDAYRRVLALA